MRISYWSSDVCSSDLDAPRSRAVVRLDHPAPRGWAARGVDRRSATKQGPRCGWHAARRGLELGQMLVVGQAANDRRGAQIRQAMLVAQQGKQHFRIEEAAAVQKRKEDRKSVV